MKIAVLGATGRIGRHVVEQALARGHEVSALVRDPSRVTPKGGRLQVSQGSVLDAVAVFRALAGADAVIAALGPARNRADVVAEFEEGMLHTVEAMRHHGIRRVVNLSGAGITAPGEHKPWLDRVATRVVRWFAPHVVAAKQAEYDLLATTDLEWVAVRPALVTDGPLTARYIAGPHALRPGARISRADVAHLLLAEAERPSHVGHPGIFVRSR